MRRKIFVIIGLVLLGLVLVNLNIIVYGFGQAKGQLKILWKARPLEDLLGDSTVDDSVKQKLKLVQEIRKFAFSELGLQHSDSYTKMYDQKGQDILWVVTACDRYAFNPKIWSFPVIGSFTYKGFFNLENAKKLFSSLEDEGLDTEIRSVNGWSTLGWFNDPILSNMLAEEDGELAATIIHELTHGTVFIPDSMTFNENLATFIGIEGSKRFLHKRYGMDSPILTGYLKRKDDSRLFTMHVVNGAHKLDSLYQTMEYLPEIKKKERKTKMINKIVRTLDTVTFNNSSYKYIFSKRRPNNAYLISFLNYRERQTELSIQLVTDFDNDLKKFITYWRKFEE